MIYDRLQTTLPLQRRVGGSTNGSDAFANTAAWGGGEGALDPASALVGTVVYVASRPLSHTAGSIADELLDALLDTELDADLAGLAIAAAAASPRRGAELRRSLELACAYSSK